jgi:diguanylate cyclase (GGDEF)-like protein/PAS domain S-box-containing protein
MLQRHHTHFTDEHFHLWLLILPFLIRVVAVYYLTLLITRPLDYLSRVAHVVSNRRDYSVRATRASGGEIGFLIDAFNQLLDHIQSEDHIRQATEQRLRHSEERYALAVRGAKEGLWDWDAPTGFSYLSPRLNAMYGEPEVESWMSMEDWIGRIHPDDRARVQADIGALLQSSQSTLSLEYRVHHADGSYRWMLSRGAVVRDANGVPIRMAGSQSDITQAKTTDPATGMPNRLFFLDALDGALRHQPGRCAVLFVDLDNFSLFVNSLGRPAGDDLILQVAGRLRTLARLASTTPPAVVARTAGDEFAILLSAANEESTAHAAATRILETLREPFFIEDQRLSASASIGVAWGGPGMDPETLLHNAETAGAHAATQGKAQIAVFHPDMRESAAVRLEVVSGLRTAIDLDQLRLHYQPVVNLRDRSLIGFESLVRWQHPQRGLLPPGSFIPIAEESDLILDVGHWVLREACRQMAEWHERFPASPPFTIGVNLSARQMNDPRFADEVALVLRQTGLDPRSLRLEITEGGILSRSDDVLATLHSLRSMQIGLVIDDFGTGYSSLSYLQRLPFSTLKIDRSFVQELGAGDGSPEIVRTILQLGRSLHMKVIAEGVETAEHLAALIALGCGFAQGYYFSRPLDARTAESLLRQPGPLLPFAPAPAESPQPACAQPA